MKKLILPVLCVLVFALTSCNNFRIVKRHYTGGFYVETGAGNTSRESNAGNSPAAATEPKANVAVDDKQPASATAIQNQEEPQLSAAPALVPQTEPSSTAEGNSIAADVNEERTTSDETLTSEKVKSEATPAPAGDAPLWVLVLLALFIPPLAVFLKSGVTNIFWIDLILFILGYGLFRYTPYLWGAALAAVVIAFLVVFDVL
jgi:uncharacterized membrane protein YqaE (UPF0057 family)